MGKKKLAEAYILGIPFGLFGAHHFYLGRKGFGLLYVCTLGLFGLGYLYDLIRMRWLVKHANRREPEKVMVSDVYLIGALGGIFGAHHFYLGNKNLGIFYAFTLGMFTMGWMADLIRMKYLVKDYNADTNEKSLGTAYILALPPLGIPLGLFGVHHFYLGRKGFGILYFCTLGLFGLGYLYDLIRMRWLVKHTNRREPEKVMVSDVYLIGALGGIFGAHHFYLGNKKLGSFYVCTLGVLTMGWIADLIRMKYLVKDYNDHTNEKSLGTAYILALPPFGIFGAYHYYLGNIKLGSVYTCTFGIFGIGWIVDLFRMSKLVRKAGLDKKSIGTSYIMALPPFGLFGAHHYYLGNYFLGIVYTCTLGIFTIGWITDLFRMKNLVKASNDPTYDYGTTKVTAYMFCMSPLGLFGAHHFYLERYLNGGFYVATLGLFGFGWFFDMLRLPVLYERYADEDKHKYPDEAYLYWFPFGLFGLHHFYLENKKWGIIYACTLGCLGIGWLIDGIRLRMLLKKYNKCVEDPDMNDFRICRPSCRSCSVNRCKRCCYELFSCGCFENFSLCRSTSKTENETNGEVRTTPRDDFEMMSSDHADGYQVHAHYFQGEEHHLIADIHHNEYAYEISKVSENEQEQFEPYANENNDDNQLASDEIL